jgi:hypothetical protein
MWVQIPPTLPSMNKMSDIEKSKNEPRNTFRRSLVRARRINSCLNRAIILNDQNKIIHWQIIILKHYEVTNEKKQTIL